MERRISPSRKSQTGKFVLLWRRQKAKFVFFLPLANEKGNRRSRCLPASSPPLRIRGNLASPSLLLIAAATRIKRLRNLLTLEMVSCRTQSHQRLLPSPHSSFLSAAAKNKGFHQFSIGFKGFKSCLCFIRSSSAPTVKISLITLCTFRVDYSFK